VPAFAHIAPYANVPVHVTPPEVVPVFIFVPAKAVEQNINVRITDKATIAFFFMTDSPFLYVGRKKDRSLKYSGCSSS